MPLLGAYTISFVDNECRKIVVDFADPTPSDYEKSQLIKFFKKYKKEIFAEFEKEKIYFIVCNWAQWVEFLIWMGFRNNADAVCSILTDLEQEKAVDPLEYLNKLKTAKPVDLSERGIVERPSEKRYECMKKRYIRK